MIDELKLISGTPLVLPNGIVVNHPKISDICEYGEERYYNELSTLVAVPQDFRVMLYDNGIDCDEISEFDLFLMLYRAFAEQDISIFFGDIRLGDFGTFLDNKTGELVLYNEKTDTLINEFTHREIITFLRKINRIEKEIKKSGNSFTKRRLIEIERQNMMFAKKEDFKSIISPQISGLVNSAGFKYDYKTCMELPVYAFFDAVYRVQKIKYFDALLHGIYAGTVDSKKVSKDELNWMG